MLCTRVEVGVVAVAVALGVTEVLVVVLSTRVEVGVVAVAVALGVTEVLVVVLSTRVEVGVVAVAVALGVTEVLVVVLSTRVEVGVVAVAVALGDSEVLVVVLLAVGDGEDVDGTVDVAVGGSGAMVIVVRVRLGAGILDVVAEVEAAVAVGEAEDAVVEWLVSVRCVLLRVGVADGLGVGGSCDCEDPMSSTCLSRPENKPVPNSQTCFQAHAAAGPNPCSTACLA